ncbi:uncharacterized protein LOC142403475 [Mycteria americana]|uniref:uncharacterized protein LOC142403475 n=1 Tax=Mycteria americana TaxID=33587 RepID=UPI003F5864F2
MLPWFPAGPGPSLLFSAEGHLVMAPSHDILLPSTVSSFCRVSLGAKTLEARSALTGTWLIAPPFLQPHNIVPGANRSPKSRLPASPCFGLHLSLPDVATAPTSPVVPLAEGTWSQCPTDRTSSWAALLQGATGESPEPGGPGPCLLSTTSAPQAGKVDSPVSDALASQSSNNLPVPLDAVPKGRGFLGLLPASTLFPASSLLGLAAKAQLGSPDPAPTPSTLPPCLLSPSMLLSLMGEQAPGRGAWWPWRPDAQDLAAHRVPPKPKGMHPSVTGQPLTALLSPAGYSGLPWWGRPWGAQPPPGPLACHQQLALLWHRVPAHRLGLQWAAPGPLWAAGSIF